MKSLESEIRKISSQVQAAGEYWKDKLQEDFGVLASSSEGKPADPIILRQVHQILSIMPAKLVKACGINRLLTREDMGPSRPYLPNHGYFFDHSVTLNSDIFYNPDTPDDFIDHRGYFVSRPTQTLLHEMGHGLDSVKGDLSLKEPWLKLSSWSATSQPGLKRLVIKEKDMPEMTGEWFYDPKAEFTRFYAKRNPWDDWADSFAFYVCRMDNCPSKQREYFDNLLKPYY